ncbi:uncharacterized protein BX664DRAFT_317510 [Halteromyces radiatus]|uniref:uncharacterized protein n=1 Tax=Halteromyces radiatus TaxID=101107 RepID=UPI002220CBED|nr:uncharacterized protein BX664DRAFT_317510 [Halteromyces radiatus]KAI8081646.1 hypothetical protein BX664DRAFT_317510 [Halteromyces radiatus]
MGKHHDKNIDDTSVYVNTSQVPTNTGGGLLIGIVVTLIICLCLGLQFGTLRGCLGRYLVCMQPRQKTDELIETGLYEKYHPTNKTFIEERLSSSPILVKPLPPIPSIPSNGWTS